MLLRWLKYNAVGAMGIVVQLAALAAFQTLLALEYLAATALAVECAVLHNFAWHERWTWKERRASDGVFTRLVRFNLSTGALSIVSNVVVMRLLVGAFHLPVLPANLASIAAASLVNFAVSETWVFR